MASEDLMPENALEADATKHLDSLKSLAGRAQGGMKVVAWRYRAGSADEHWNLSPTPVYVNTAWRVEVEPLVTLASSEAALAAERVKVEGLTSWLVEKINEKVPFPTGIDADEKHMAAAQEHGRRLGMKECLAWLESLPRACPPSAFF